MRFALLCLLALAGCSKEQSPTMPTRQLPATAPTASPTKPAPAIPAKKVYSQEDFRALVTNKTQDDVVKLIGKADHTTLKPEANSMMIVWQYREITQDKYAKNPDRIVELWFSERLETKDFRVYDVRYP